MQTQFAFQLIISFFAGGLLIALQTLFAERMPLKWRGIVLTIPTTMAMGLLFVGLTKSAPDVVEVARVIPAGLGANYMYVMMFAVLSPFGLTISVLGSFVVFVLLDALIIFFPPVTMATSFFLYGLPAILIGYLIVEKLPQVTRLKPYPMNWKHVGLRSLMGGFILSGGFYVHLHHLLFFPREKGNSGNRKITLFSRRDRIHHLCMDYRVHVPVMGHLARHPCFICGYFALFLAHIIHER